MVSELRNGQLPDDTILRKRFEAALVKKMAVIRTPYSLWPGDPKINPPAKQLLWAAILLQDQENFYVVAAIISAELEEKLRAKGQTGNQHDRAAQFQQLLDDYLQEFIGLGPEGNFREMLNQKVHELFPELSAPKS